MRALAAVLAALCLAGCGAKAQSVGTNGAIRISASPVALDPNARRPPPLGDFHYEGGLQLVSPDTTRLGGLSDLRIDADGRLTAVGDDGDLFRAHLVLDGDRRVAALDNASLRPLTGLDGKALQGKTASDAEGLAIWPNGDVMVSFERDHRIWLYPAAGGPPRAIPMPPAGRMAENEGMEGLSLAARHGPDAYWVGLEAGSIWLCHLNDGCVEQKGQVRPALGYRLTALSETEAGDLVVLHHGYNPILKTSRMRAWITRPGSNGQTRVVAKLDIKPPLTVDNFEGVETALLPHGGLRLFVLSDDNFSTSQRTLLMTFDWLPVRRP